MTVEPGGYFAFDDEMLEEVRSSGATIVRTPSWDPTRLFGRKKTVTFPSESSRNFFSILSQFLFIPDNKVGWIWHAVQEGKKLIESQHFDAIFSSAPPYSAHLIGALLSRRGKIPLLTDYRDDWVDNPRHVYPTPLHRYLNERLENWVFSVSSHTTTINRQIQDSLVSRNTRNGLLPPVSILNQGFDPADFRGVPVNRDRNKMRILYSGVFYDAQKPDVFLRALAAFVKGRPEVEQQIEAVFVGLVPPYMSQLLKELGIEGLVSTPGYLGHKEAISYLQSADVLWMIVGKRSGAASISTGKLFEYMGTGKPILALVPEGAARSALEPYGAVSIAEPDSIDDVCHALDELFQCWKRGELPKANREYVSKFDRNTITGELADYLDLITKD